MAVSSPDSLPRTRWPAPLYCERRYLGAVLGGHFHDPLDRLRSLPGKGLPTISVHGHTRLLDEALAEAPGGLGGQHPAHALTYVPVGVQGALRDVEEGARLRLQGIASH